MADDYELTLRDMVEIIEDQWNCHLDENEAPRHDFIILNWDGQPWSSSVLVSGRKDAVLDVVRIFVLEGWHAENPTTRDNSTVVEVSPQ